MSKGKWKINISKHSVDKTQCRKCLYRAGKSEWAMFSCAYIFFMGQLRPCEPSPNCTAFKGYNEKERQKLESELRQKFVIGEEK